MPISDDDLNYLRNLNTRPGPNAGRSIDPTKPGPDADSASPEPQDVREALQRAKERFAASYDPNNADDGEIFEAGWFAALAQSDAEPHRDPDDTKVICPNCTHQFRAISVMDQARLAQSDAGPPPLRYSDKVERAGDGTETRRLELAQSDAGPVRTAPETCPHCFNEEDCGQIELCSALAKGPQSDAEPVAWQTRRRGSVDWRICIGEPSLDAESYEARPLYTAPPRPDRSGK